jgi:hypothetical protein
LPKPKCLEPVRNMMHWLHRPFGRRLPGLGRGAGKTLFLFFPNGTHDLF